MKKIHIFVILVLTAALCAGAVPAFALFYPADVRLNSAPVAENLALETYRQVSVSGAFKALDPEGDPVTFSVVRQPKKGEVEVTDGDFVYTPAQGKKGKDTFTYTAMDDKGNVSNEAVVTIEIKKQKTAVTYSDMTGSGDAYAAVLLAEKGVFVGQQIGGKYVFDPEEPVTRGEFLVMCMSLSGVEILDVARTGFFDDNEIPVWQKPYLTTALTNDVVRGSALSDGRIVFSPNDPVTFAEATVMVNNALGITDVALEEEPAEPAWAVQASANLTSCGIFDTVSDGVSASHLTRADAARMLEGAIRVLEEREDDSLLGWLK